MFFLLRRLLRAVWPFRRGDARASAMLTDLAATLTAAGHPATPVDGDSPEKPLAQALGARSRGLLRIERGPPDLVLATGASSRGHLADTRLRGFHWLIRREGLAEAWPEGRVEARRDFRGGDVGAARSFHWEPADASPPSRAAAERLNDLGAGNDPILNLLRDPGTLAVEMAPHPDLGVIRLSLVVGNRDTLDRSDVTAVLRFCAAFARAAEAGPG